MVSIAVTGFAITIDAFLEWCKFGGGGELASIGANGTLTWRRKLSTCTLRKRQITYLFE